MNSSYIQPRVPELVVRQNNTFIVPTPSQQYNTFGDNPIWYIVHKFTFSEGIVRLLNVSVNAYNSDFCKIIIFNDHQKTKPIILNNASNKLIKNNWFINTIRNSFVYDDNPIDYLYEQYLYRSFNNDVIKFIPDETNSLLTEEVIPDEGEFFNGREVDIVFGNNTISNKKTELQTITPNIQIEERYGQ